MNDEANDALKRELQHIGQDKTCCGQSEALSKVFKALGHPARVMILSKLAMRDSHCCGDICSELPLAQSTVSQHLKVLRENGLIELETAGQQSHYRISLERVKAIASANAQFFDLIIGQCENEPSPE